MGKKLYVGSLAYSIKNNELEQMFSEAGAVQSVQVVMDPVTGQGKGYAFVEMLTDEDAARAIQALNSTIHNGRSIIVTEAKPERINGKKK